MAREGAAGAVATFRATQLNRARTRVLLAALLRVADGGRTLPGNVLGGNNRGDKTNDDDLLDLHDCDYDKQRNMFRILEHYEVLGDILCYNVNLRGPLLTVGDRREGFESVPD